MTQIDMSKWGKFKVGELFDCETTKGIASKNDLVEGNIPYVTRSAENNGKSGYCGNADRIVKGNCITIGAEGFTAFYQENDFVAGNKVYALRHRNLNNVNALYICTVLNKLSCLYSFNNARILDKIKQEVISLPIDNNGEPDWQYMEDYMKEITKLAAKRVEKVKEEKAQTKIEIINWGNVRVGDLFEIKLSKNNIRFERCNTGSTPLISAGNENNGIVGYIDKEDFEVFPANSITVNVFGKAFVQTKDFCASVNILIIRNEHLTKNIGMFIAAILSKNHSKYNYNDKISKNKLFNETISLPVTPEGTPDFDYVENYMKEITEKAEKKI